MVSILKFIIKLAMVFSVIMIIYCIIFRKWIIRKYRFDLFVGKPGCGKTTMMVAEATKGIKKGRTVYSNIAIDVPEVRVFHAEDIGLGKYFEPESLVLIDEPNLYWDNRQFKSIKKDTIEWFRLYRHNRVTIKMYTQTFDIDKKLRALCSDIHICQKILGTITLIRRLQKNIKIKDSALDAESQIVDELKFVPIFMPGAFKINFIPKWTKYFDSYALPEGDQIDYYIVK